MEKSENNVRLTTAEWVAKEALGLACEVTCHVKVMTDLDESGQAALVRLLMMSVRNWDEHRRDSE